MSFDQSGWVWMNGGMTRWADATIHVSVHALHYGTGVFEGIRCYPTGSGPAVFRLREHLDRLRASAAIHGIEIPYSREQLSAAVAEVVARNGFDSCYIRPICFFGSSVLGLNPAGCPVETAVLAWPWNPLLGASAAEQGVRVTVSPWTKLDPAMIPTRAKACGQYLNSILAVRDAHARGFDEALLIETDGSLSEGSGENIFLVKDGRLRTNDERHSILLGITRDSVIQLARDLGIPVDTGTLDTRQLLAADEAFFTGTAAEVVPIRELDGQGVGGGSRGPITARLQRAYRDATRGLDARHLDWLERVPGAEGSRNRDAMAAVES